MSSIFTTESGEWKLGGFEVLSSMKDDDPVIYVGTNFKQLFEWKVDVVF